LDTIWNGNNILNFDDWQQLFFNKKSLGACHIQKLTHFPTKESAFFLQIICHIEFFGHFEFLRKIFLKKMYNKSNSSIQRKLPKKLNKV
jgi:hypothetical protein